MPCRSRQGNALLAGIYEARGELQAFQAECTRRKALIVERKPRWELLLRLLEQAEDLPIVQNIQQQVEAIRRERALLNEPDPVAPLLAQLGDALRQAVHNAKANVDRAHDREVQSLADTPEWNELSDTVWEKILHEQKLGPVPEPDVSTDEALLKALIQHPLSVWDSEAAAMPTRLQKAREEAAQRLNPKAIRVPVPSATLQNEAEVDAYLHKLPRRTHEVHRPRQAGYTLSNAMNRQRFQHSPSGRLLNVGQGETGYQAFLPNPLPPDITARSLPDRPAFGCRSGVG